MKEILIRFFVTGSGFRFQKADFIIPIICWNLLLLMPMLIHAAIIAPRAGEVYETRVLQGTIEGPAGSTSFVYQREGKVVSESFASSIGYLGKPMDSGSGYFSMRGEAVSIEQIRVRVIYGRKWVTSKINS